MRRRIILRPARIFYRENKNLFRTVGYGMGFLLRSFAVGFAWLICGIE